MVARRRGWHEYRAAAIAYGHYDDMAQPEVIYLKFDVIVDDPLHDLAAKTARLEGQLGDFDFVLDNRQLDARPRRRFVAPDEAEAAIAPYLRDWESHADLTGKTPIKFLLRHFAVVNRASGADAGPKNCVATMSDWANPGETRTVRVAAEYPKPPARGWHTNELLDSMRLRWREVYHQRAPIAAEAYFVLSHAEAMHGGRNGAADALRIDRVVLRTMGALAAVGDRIEGRKAAKASTRGGVAQRRLSSGEKAWLFAAGQEVMIRLACDPVLIPLPRLTMNDLPPLNEVGDPGESSRIGVAKDGREEGGATEPTTTDL